MTNSVAYGLAVAALLVAVFAGWHTLTRRPFSNPLFYVLGLLEIAMIAMLVGGVAALNVTSRDVDGVLCVSYLVTVAVIPPAATLWGIAEKSRWGTGVVVVAMLTVAVLCVRILDIWKGPHV